jgi:hypothetical protein
MGATNAKNNKQSKNIYSDNTGFGTGYKYAVPI